MDWLSLLYQIFEVCIIPLLGVLVAFGVNVLRAKVAELNAKQENELLVKYSTMLSETVIECVLATKQTYVDSLKASGSFDAEAQKRAFELSKDAVLAVLNEEAKDYLSNIYGDLETKIQNLIEAEVNKTK